MNNLFGSKSWIDFNCWLGLQDCKVSACSICWSRFFFYLFCECFSTRRTCRLTCSIICTDGNVYSSVKYSYSSILIHENADIFAAALLISHYSFSAKIVSSVVVITFSILSKTMHLKHGLLSAGKIVSFTKKKWFCSTFFVKIYKVFEVILN